MQNNYAVMGNPIAHSLSPLIHELFAAQKNITLNYIKIQIDESHFEEHVKDFFNHGGKGLNITLPCKERAFAMSDKQSPRCLKANAANTLWMQSDKLYADNTDGIGLVRDLARFHDLKAKRILILGAGGATRGIIAPLLDKKPTQLTIANRTLQKAQQLEIDFPEIDSSDFLTLHSEYEIIINATSASVHQQPLLLPEQVLARKPFCYDLSYALNSTTPFVAWARTNGCESKDGLGMLVEQAAESFFIWHGVRPDGFSVLNQLRSSC